MTMKTPFDEAVARYGATVLRVCRAALGPGPDADDAWQETFLSALRAWPDLPEDTIAEAWLVRVAQRKTVDIVRANARRAVPYDEAVTAAVDLRTHDAGLQDEAAQIWHDVARLPERQRLALAYHYLGGLPHAETASMIGGSAAAVRRAAADGIATLRRNYAAGAQTTPDQPQNTRQEGEHR